MNLPIEIHVWGGFGSQLNALLLYWHLNEFYPQRSASLVFHSSGITRREPEILNLMSSNDSYKFIDDFRNTHEMEVSRRSLRTKLLQRILELLRLIIFSSGYTMFHIKPWTLQLRSSYSGVCFSEKLLKNLAQKIRSAPTIPMNCVNSAHYRAGDLVSKKQESLISPEIFFKQLLDVAQASRNPQDFDLFTDSLGILTTDLQDFSHLFLPSAVFRLHSLDVSPTNLLINCLNSETFVGTSSKVSIWIALLRASEGKPNTRLPKSLENNFMSMSPNSFWKYVDFYPN